MADRATIWIDDGNSQQGPERERKLREIRAYMYGGWEYAGWGSHDDRSGFFFEGPAGGGFGAENQLDRLASGLHFGRRIES